MKSASVFVLPSVREGYGMVVAEALCCGLPVITVDHPENEARELVEDGVSGLICEPTLSALAVALAKVFENGEMLSVSLEHAGRFAWTESVHSLEEVYRLASTLTGGRI
jgi:glycosyltransferase involved in cell wall biosynthesis